MSVTVSSQQRVESRKLSNPDSLTMLRVAAWCIFFAATVPTLNFMRYGDVVSFWSDVGVVLFVGLGLIFLSLSKSDFKSTKMPVIVVCSGIFLLVGILPHVQKTALLGALIPFFSSVFMALSGGLVLWRAKISLGLNWVVARLATMIFGIGLVQTGIGLLQVFNLSYIGLLSVDFVGYSKIPLFLQDLGFKENIMGNIAQRNNYAHFLMLGIFSGCYLWATQIRGKLSSALFFLGIVTLSLLAAWSQARLLIAYAGVTACCLPYWYFFSKGRINSIQKRFLLTLMVAVVCLVISLFAGEVIANGLRHLGLPVVEGLDTALSRVGSSTVEGTGLNGSRRMIEWQKAWMIFQSYPLFGVGVGGFAWQSLWLEYYGGLAHSSEFALFAHPHSLVAILLAEVGLVGSLLVFGTFGYCLLPYFKKSNLNAENHFLILLALVGLIHSLFEYPFWYLYFLLIFMIVLVLSPTKSLLMDLPVLLRRAFGFVFGLIFFIFSVQSISVFSHLANTARLSNRDLAVVEQNILYFSDLRTHPIWRKNATHQLLILLPPTKQSSALFLPLYEDFVKLYPMDGHMFKLSILYAYQNRPADAIKAMRLLLMYYPMAASSYAKILEKYNQAELAPLFALAHQASDLYESAYTEAMKQKLAEKPNNQETVAIRRASLAVTDWLEKENETTD
jgi:O-antigen ligase